jgi:hypothetical protein
MENRHAIRLRNTVAAIWLGFGGPSACIWIVLADRHDWGDRHPFVAIVVLVVFLAPIILIGLLEFLRRKAKGKLKPP